MAEDTIIEELCYLVILKAQRRFSRRFDDKEMILKSLEGLPMRGIVIERGYILYYWVGGMTKKEVWEVKRRVTDCVLGYKIKNISYIFKKGYRVCTVGMPDFESVNKYISK